MIVIDTNVLIYSAGRDHPLREPCRRLLESVAQARTDATTTVEVIQEFLHQRSRSRSREDATQIANEYATLLSPLLVVGDRELRAGIRLFERHADLDAFDAVLAAATIANEAMALVSADVAFADVPRLRHVHPTSPELDGLIGS